MATDKLVNAGIDEVNEMLIALGHLIQNAVMEQVDHPALPTLRAAYLSIEELYNAFEVARLRGWTTVPVAS